MERAEKNLLRRLQRLAAKQGLRIAKPYFREPFKIEGVALLKPSGKLAPNGQPIYRQVLGKPFASLGDVARYLGAAVAVLVMLARISHHTDG